MNRRRNTVIVLAALAAVVVLAVIGSRLRGSSALPVRLVNVSYGDFTTRLPETGVVQRPRLVSLPAGVGGNVGTILVKAGDRVSQGQLLATIENPQLQSSLQSDEAAAASAAARAKSAASTNAALPAQNRANVVQAQAAVVQARAQLNQARQDLASGSQSGLGYGGQSAEEQRLAADATLHKAETDLREAKRTYDANVALFDQRGVSRDALEQSHAKYDEAQIDFQQAQRERSILEGQLTRNGQVLRDRVRAAEDALRQAEASLQSARAAAGTDKSGDVEAAREDAARAADDASFAADQVARMQVRAPFTGTVESVATQTGDSLRPLQPGDQVTQGQPLFTMSDGDAFIVRTKVDEQDVAAVRLGQKAIVSGEDFAGKTLTGRVAAVSPLAVKSDDPSNTSRQVLTTIRLDSTFPFLRDGMSVDVDLITRELHHVLTVPVDAIRKDEKGATYVLVQRAGKAVRSNVHLGPQSDTRAVVSSGIAAGDVVVADKNPALAPNVRVTAAPSPSPGPSVAPAQ
jgi:RND family efflux transporter MFP subunit